MTDPHLADRVRGAVRDVAVALLPQLPDIGVESADYICSQVPDIDRAGAGDVVLATCQANAATFLDYLVRGVPLESYATSAEIVQLTRDVVQRGLPLTAVIRGYRVGAQHLVQRWTDAVATYGPNDRTAAEVVGAVTSFILRWSDLLVDRLTDEYRSEDERLARERSLARLEHVRWVLNDSGLDSAVAELRLGYRLAGRHIALALRDCTDKSDAGAALDAAVRQLTQTMGASYHLAVRVDMRTVWCWVPCSVSLPQRPRPVTVPVVVAVGRPGTGLVGFRNSHRDALDALRVAELAGSVPGTVTYYDDVDVAAMCSADLEKCRDFVRAELGVLSADDVVTRRHRETLIAFYAADSNFRATAAKLGIHHNTVRYRLDHAERALGHPLDERRLPLELALHLHATFGSAFTDSE